MICFCALNENQSSFKWDISKCNKNNRFVDTSLSHKKMQRKNEDVFKTRLIFYNTKW